MILRHGHSAWNLSSRFTGWADILLNETGMEQAVRIDKVEIPSGIPLLYTFDESLAVVDRQWLET